MSAPAGSTRWGAWTQAALANTAQPYPHNAAHLTAGPDDRRLPAELHPAFHTSYDWHSDVHMHWLLAALLRRHPESVDADAVIARLDADLTPAALQVEAGYLREAPQLERPYGWGWLLVLAAEIAELSQDAAVAGVRMRSRAWPVALRPLVTVVRANILGWISHTYAPVRTGVHDNSAFGLLLISCAAAHLGDAEVRRVVADATHDWFGADRAAPVAYEPGGLDFLPPTLVEAHLMVRVLPAGEIAAWLAGVPALSASTRRPHGCDRRSSVISPMHARGTSSAWLSIGPGTVECWPTPLPTSMTRLSPGCAKRRVATRIGRKTS